MEIISCFEFFHGVKQMLHKSSSQGSQILCPSNSRKEITWFWKQQALDIICGYKLQKYIPG